MPLPHPCPHCGLRPPARMPRARTLTCTICHKSFVQQGRGRNRLVCGDVCYRALVNMHRKAYRSGLARWGDA